MKVKEFLITSTVFAVGFAVRMVLVAYGVWQDRTHRFRYTDVDYDVITDGAAFVVAGGSPYQRATYRYSPLVAWMLVPGHWLGISEYFGKILWCLCDIIAAVLIYRASSVSQLQKRPEERWKWRPLIAACLWLFNPVSINISTRGNYDAVVCVLVAGCMCAVASRRIVPLSICLGLAVHLRVYPAIYAFPLLFQVHYWSDHGRKRHWILLTGQQWLFGILAFGVFVAISVLCYVKCGWDFLQHTYLYHLTRVDHRHNLSVYWYHVLLELWSQVSNPVPTPLWQRLGASLISFVPQIAALAAVARRFCITNKETEEDKDGPKPAKFADTAFGMWAMTVLFVSFNKVYTVQYFAWWLVLLPLAELRSSTVSLLRLLRCALLWGGALVLWLMVAYRLEFGGENTMLSLWGCGIILFVASVEPVAELCYIRAHCSTKVKTA